LSVAGQQLRVHFYDRSGCSISLPFDIHSNPKAFVAILAAVMFGPRQCIGFDPTLTIRPTLPLWVRDTVYEIMEILFSSGRFLGRGTVVYRVRHEGRMYIIKDHWVENPSQERNVMKCLKGTPGVPALIDHWEVEISPHVVDTTSWYWSEELQACMKGKRTHVRTVISPCGRPLTKFRSKRELVIIIRDVLLGK
ncbi:hypothetical protein EDD15DRAFT_2118825, partial [Pisolithus albus]